MISLPYHSAAARSQGCVITHQTIYLSADVRLSGLGVGLLSRDEKGSTRPASDPTIRILFLDPAGKIDRFMHILHESRSVIFLVFLVEPGAGKEPDVRSEIWAGIEIKIFSVA